MYSLAQNQTVYLFTSLVEGSSDLAESPQKFVNYACKT